MSPRVLRAGLTYFLAVFAVGMLLGTIRVLWVVPRFGERAAELAETPIMLLVTVLAARWVVQRHEIPARLAQRLAVGALALALLLACELTVVLALRGLSLQQYLEGRDPLAGMAYVAALLFFAVAPVFVGRAEAGSDGP
jgi:hypothetical protein